MANNRYYSPDQSRWWGPTHIGAGLHDPEKRISKFIFDGPDGSPVAKLRSAYVGAVEAVSALRTKRIETEGSKRFTPLGVSEHVAEHAVTENIPALRRARTVVEKVKGQIAEKRSKLTLAKPTDEQRRDHEEVRAAMRGMSAGQRETFLKQNRQDPVVAAAVAHASIPALTGLDPLVHQHIVSEQIEREHGETIAELADLEEVVGVVDRVTGLARDELREVIGVSPDVFERIAKVGESGDGELPFRVEKREIDGETREVCRVYDLDAKTWRDASQDEILKVAT
jgi:hypothetical protein